MAPSHWAIVQKDDAPRASIPKTCWEAKTKKPTEVGFFSERFRCLFGCAGKI